MVIWGAHPTADKSINQHPSMKYRCALLYLLFRSFSLALSSCAMLLILRQINSSIFVFVQVKRHRAPPISTAAKWVMCSMRQYTHVCRVLCCAHGRDRFLISIQHNVSLSPWKMADSCSMLSTALPQFARWQDCCVVVIVVFLIVTAFFFLWISSPRYSIL